MKTLKTIFGLTLLLGLLVFSSCSDDDDPEVTGSIDVTITGLPSGVDADVVLVAEDDTETAIIGSTSLTSLSLGVYILQINSVDDGGARYIASEEEITVNVSDASGESVTIEYAEFSSVNGIVGTWASKGEDVAPLLVQFFAVDSVITTFNSNQTYEVLQYAGSATTPLTLSGTYSQSLSSTGNIWTITVEQTAPSALTSEGIFEIMATANPNSMQYEIAQTSPDIGAIPPSPEDGFGSTSGGLLGDTNIQTYKRRSY